MSGGTQENNLNLIQYGRRPDWDSTLYGGQSQDAKQEHTCIFSEHARGTILVPLLQVTSMLFSTIHYHYLSSTSTCLAEKWCNTEVTDWIDWLSHSLTHLLTRSFTLLNQMDSPTLPLYSTHLWFKCNTKTKFKYLSYII